MAEEEANELKPALVSILGPNSKPLGCGFLISPGHVLTCAHVVDAARAAARDLKLEFSFLADKPRYSARVVLRCPESPFRPDSYPPADGLDLALLKLEGNDLPTSSRPAPLVELDDVWNLEIRVFGFPAGKDGGVWATGTLRDRQTSGWLQVDEAQQRAYFIQPGFSGSPVWVDRARGIAGMVVAADQGSHTRAAFMIPTAMLLGQLPDLADLGVRRPSRGPFKCLTLTPRVEHPADRAKQKEAVRVIREAIRVANDADPKCQLTIERQGFLVEVADLDSGHIAELRGADLVIVDANAYGSETHDSETHDRGIASLFYLLAMLHAWDLKVLLVAKSTEHLPGQLKLHKATLKYSPELLSLEERFYPEFQKAAARLLQGDADDWANPIQTYEKRERARRQLSDLRQRALNAQRVQDAVVDEIKRMKAELAMTGRKPPEPPTASEPAAPQDHKPVVFIPKPKSTRTQPPRK